MVLTEAVLAGGAAPEDHQCRHDRQQQQGGDQGDLGRQVGEVFAPDEVVKAVPQDGGDEHEEGTARKE